MSFIIVFPAPTTTMVAKHVSNKYLSRERRNTLRIRKYSIHHLFDKLLEKYSKVLKDETKEKFNE